jgi:hypothetical protein
MHKESFIINPNTLLYVSTQQHLLVISVFAAYTLSIVSLLQGAFLDI